MASRYSLQEISSVAERKVFFDANVLIYLFWPTSSHIREKEYAKAYADLIIQGNILLVDYTVLSEVINVALRAEYAKHLLHHQLSNSNFKFKDFRNSADGQNAVNDIFLTVKHAILDMFDVVGRSFTKNEVDAFLCYDSLDFIDKGIETICRENDLVLVTNDKDFASSEIDILSSNPILLNG